MKRGEAKRLALLQAAAALIAEKGIAGATTREIAECAESTERTLFKQFGSKEGLISAVLDMVAQSQMARSGFATLSSDPPRDLDAFEAWHKALVVDRVQALTPRTEVGQRFLLEIIQNQAFKAKYAGPWKMAVWGPLTACIDDLKARGAIDGTLDTQLLVQSFMSLNLGYLVARLNVAPQLDWDVERDTAGIAALFRRAIAPR